MAGIALTPTWEPEVYQLETTDLVVGGSGGISNLQPEQLGNRTEYLKAETDRILQTGLFAGGTELAEHAPGDVLTTAIGGKVLLLADDGGGPYSGMGKISLPSLAGMDAAFPDGASVAIVSAGHSFELVLDIDGGGNFTGYQKPWGSRFFAGFGTVILRFVPSTVTGAAQWVVMSECTSETSTPAGMFAPFPTGSPVAPGWLNCDGDTPLKADYPLLWAAIGTTYGPATTGPATTATFTLPETGSTIDALTGMVWRIKT